MTNRRDHFEAQTSAASAEAGTEASTGIWELPDHVIDVVSGALDFSQSAPGGGVNFAQNFSCFAQGIGNFSSGTPPRLQEYESVNGG